jgi:DNA-binding response OmpR family regulator
VLVVEDDLDIAQIYRVTLEAAGHDVLIAPDGEKALNELGRARFDLILLDINLPKLSGFEVLERLPGLRVTAPVYVLSNYSGDELESRARSLGAVGWKLKSRLMPKDLVALVATVTVER